MTLCVSKPGSLWEVREVVFRNQSASLLYAKLKPLGIMKQKSILHSKVRLFMDRIFLRNRMIILGLLYYVLDFSVKRYLSNKIYTLKEVMQHLFQNKICVACILGQGRKF